MYTYDSDAYRRFCAERADELARAYRRTERDEHERETEQGARLRRAWAFLQRPHRAPAYRP